VSFTQSSIYRLKTVNHELTMGSLSLTQSNSIRQLSDPTQPNHQKVKNRPNPSQPNLVNLTCRYIH